MSEGVAVLTFRDRPPEKAEGVETLQFAGFVIYTAADGALVVRHDGIGSLSIRPIANNVIAVVRSEP